MVIMNKTVTRIHVRVFAHTSFQILWIDYRIIIAESYVERMFSFVRNLETVFQSSCTILHSYEYE